jgi:hypothetical protein
MGLPALSTFYDGPFDPEWSIDQLSRAGLARLCRELMLISMLHDRALMPHVTGRGGTEAAVALADDEWMSSSPIYTARNKANLGISSDGVDGVLKSFQFDIGTPHHFLDMQGEVVDHDHGYFWLTSCGAHEYVRWVSDNDEKLVSMMCHDMEDRTFEATLRATNPRARCTPVHRPPKPDDFGGEPCRWEVTISPDDLAVQPDHPNLEVLRATMAANHQYDLGLPREPGGLDDYSGPYVSGLRLEDLSHPVLVRQVKEFQLDIHLLMRAAYLSVQQRHGDEVLHPAEIDHLAALIPPLVERLAPAMGVTGDNPTAVAKLLQLNPLLPLDYVHQRVELADDGTVELSILPSPALDDRAIPSPIDTLDHDDPTVVSAFARAVNPRAQVERTGSRCWQIHIDAAAEPSPEHPMAALVGGHNYLPADLGPRPMPVAIPRLK